MLARCAPGRLTATPHPPRVLRGARSASVAAPFATAPRARLCPLVRRLAAVVAAGRFEPRNRVDRTPLLSLISLLDGALAAPRPAEALAAGGWSRQASVEALAAAAAAASLSDADMETATGALDAAVASARPADAAAALRALERLPRGRRVRALADAVAESAWLAFQEMCPEAQAQEFNALAFNERLPRQRHRHARGLEKRLAHAALAALRPHAHDASAHVL